MFCMVEQGQMHQHEIRLIALHYIKSPIEPLLVSRRHNFRKSGVGQLANARGMIVGLVQEVRFIVGARPLVWRNSRKRVIESFGPNGDGPAYIRGAKSRGESCLP